MEERKFDEIIASFRFEDEDEDKDDVVPINFVVPAELKTKNFEDFVVAKTECFVLVLVFVLESKALYYNKGNDNNWPQSPLVVNSVNLIFTS